MIVLETLNDTAKITRITIEAFSAIVRYVTNNMQMIYYDGENNIIVAKNGNMYIYLIKHENSSYVQSLRSDNRRIVQDLTNNGFSGNIYLRNEINTPF